MATRGVKKKITTEEIAQALHEFDGNIKVTAMHLGFHRNWLHDKIDESPELQHARDTARRRCDEEEVWEAVATHKTAMEAKQQDMGQALRAAQYILGASKQSPYYKEDKPPPPQAAELVASLHGLTQQVPASIIEEFQNATEEERAAMEEAIVNLKRKQADGALKEAD